MKRLFIILIITFSCIQAFGQTNFEPEDKYKLKNKMQVIFMDYGNIPVSFVSLLVNTGTKNETPGMQSIASLTANALLLGNQKYSRVQQDSISYQLAATINAGSNDNFSELDMQFLNKDEDLAMDLFANVILHPTFPKDEISSYVEQQITYNTPAKMDIGDLTKIYSRFYVYGATNPLGRNFYAAQLNKITTDQVSEFYKFNYTPKNCILVVAGKPDKDKLKALIAKYFEGWDASYGEVNGVSLPEPEFDKKQYAFVNRENATQAAIDWVKKAPNVKSKDLEAFKIANGVFSQMLFEQVRVKEGKAYFISSNFSNEDNNETYTVNTQVRNEVMYATLESFDKVLKQFYDSGAPKDIFATIKTRMVAGVEGMESPAQLVNTFNPLLYPDYEKRKQSLAELNQIDIEKVNKVIKKYFNPADYKVMIAGSATELKPQLDKIPGLVTLPLNAIDVDN